MKAFIAILWLLTLGCWGFMLLMTHSAPDDVLPLHSLGLNDRIDHLLAFGLLGGLLSMSIWALFPKHPLLLSLGLPLLLAYAAIDEKTRPLATPDVQMRHWLADAAGAAVAVTGMYLLCGLSSVLRRSTPPGNAIVRGSGRATASPGASAGRRSDLGMEVESALASFTDADAEVEEQIIRVEKASVPSPASTRVRARATRARKAK